MNEHLRHPNLDITTQAAEGLMRRRWSVAEIEAMVAAGILDEDERFELIGGEVVPMSPKGIRHELVKNTLMIHWAQRLPPDMRMALETTLNLNQDTVVEPDVVFYRTADGLAALSPATALLVVEIADSSLSYDLNRKRVLYAVNSVQELWVIDAVTLETRIHRQPRLDTYTEVIDIPADGTLTPGFAPALAVSLASLTLA